MRYSGPAAQMRPGHGHDDIRTHARTTPGVARLGGSVPPRPLSAIIIIIHAHGQPPDQGPPHQQAATWRRFGFFGGFGRLVRRTSGHPKRSSPEEMPGRMPLAARCPRCSLRISRLHAANEGHANRCSIASRRRQDADVDGARWESRGWPWATGPDLEARGPSAPPSSSVLPP